MKRISAGFLAAIALWIVCSEGARYRAAAAQESDPLVMVVNKGNNAVPNMNKVNARKLLLGQVTDWPRGGKVTVVMRPVGNGDRVAVLRRICGMSEAEFTRYNLQAMFIGQSVANLQQGATAAAVRSIVKANRNAVGFLRKSELDDNIKAVWTLE